MTKTAEGQGRSPLIQVILSLMESNGDSRVRHIPSRELPDHQRQLQLFNEQTRQKHLALRLISLSGAATRTRSRATVHSLRIVFLTIQTSCNWSNYPRANPVAPEHRPFDHIHESVSGPQPVCMNPCATTTGLFLSPASSPSEVCRRCRRCSAIQATGSLPLLYYRDSSVPGRRQCRQRLS